MSFRRRIMMAQRSGGGGLPYDAEVEYIASTSARTQYIDTGIIPTSTTGLAAWVNSYTSSDYYLIGLRNNTGNTRWCVGYDGRYYAGYNSSIYSQYSARKALVKMNYKNDGTFNVSDFDGNSLSSANLPTLSFTPLYNIRMFGSAGLNVDYAKWRGAIYRLVVTDGSTETHDFIPVRIGIVGYMYDKTTKRLFGNSGSGDFILGSDTQIGGTCIKFTGSQYIDLGYSPNPSTQIHMNIQFIENGNEESFSANNNWMACDNNTVGDFSCNFGGLASEWGKLYFWFEDENQTITSTNYSSNITNSSTFFYSANAVYFEGVTTSCPTKTTTQDGTLCIGGNSDACFNRYDLAVFHIDIYENNILIKSFRPQQRNGVAGLYDSVNDVFVHSATGTEVDFVNG